MLCVFALVLFVYCIEAEMVDDSDGLLLIICFSFKWLAPALDIFPPCSVDYLRYGPVG